MKTRINPPSLRSSTTGRKCSKKAQPQRALAGSVGALLTCALLPSAAHGATWTWLSSGNASGTWGTSTNWSGGTPDSVDAVADFSTLNITADSTVTVGAPVTTGTMLFGDATTLSNNWIVSGSTITLATSGANGPAIVVNSQTVTLNALLLGTQGFAKSGAGTLVLSVSNGYSGGTTLSAGTLNFGDVGALGGDTVTFAGNSKLQAGVAGTLLNNVTINPGITGTLDTQANAVTLGGVVAGSGTLTKIGTGSLLLSGSNTYSGGTTLTSGSLVLGNANALGGASAGALVVNGMLDLNGFSPIASTGSLTGSGTIGNNNGAGLSTLILGGMPASATFSGILKDNLGTAGGTLGLTVGNGWVYSLTGPGITSGLAIGATSGIWIFSGSSSFTGPLVVNSGTMRISSSTARFATTSVTVTGNATLHNGNVVTVSDNTNFTNRLNPNASLTLGGPNGGGTFVALFGASGTTSQTVASLTISQGGNAIAAGNAAAGTNNLIITGSTSGAGYLRNTGGFLNVTSTTGFNPQFTNAPTAAGGSSVSGVAASGNEILVGAILNGIDFVKAASGNLAVAAYTASGTSTLATDANINVTTQGTTLSGGTILSVNSLRFPDTTQRILNLGTGSVLTVASGGILLPQNVATEGVNHTITSGTITSGVGDLWIYGASGGTSRTGSVNANPRSATYGMTISSVIADNGASLVALTVGGNSFSKVLLSGTNTFTGGVNLANGLIAINADSGLGVSSGTVTAVSGINSITPIAGFTFPSSRNFVINSGAVLQIGDLGQTNTLAGQISGGGELGIGFVSGGERLILTNTNSGFTGRYDVNGYLRAAEGVGLSSNANLNLAGRSGNNIGILETSGTFVRSLGAGAGQVEWSTPSNGYSDGGFAAVGGALTINLGGASTPVTLTQNSGGFLTGNSFLDLQDSAADSALTWSNPINNNGATLTVYQGATTSGSINRATMTGAISGAGGLTKMGSGLLILSATNSYSGATTIIQGALRATDGVGLSGSGNLIFTPNNGAATNITGNAVLETSGSFSRAIGSGANQVQFSGVGTLATGEGFSASGGAATVNLGGAGATIPFASLLTGVTGTTTLSNRWVSVSSTTGLAVGQYVYGTNVNGLTISALASGSIQLSANAAASASGVAITVLTPSTTSINGNLLILNETTADSALTLVNGLDLNGAGRTINVNAATAVITGTIVNSGGSTAGLTKGGAGTLVLAADETYNGGTTISTGTLQLGNGGATGSVVGNITDNAALAFNRSDSALVISGTISGTGAVANTGSGLVTLTASNSYSGVTTLSSGTLQLGDGSTTNGSVAGNITDNANLVVANPYAQTYAGVISGSGALVKTASGVFELTAANTFSGGATISSGTVKLSTSGNLGTGPINIGGAVMVVNRTDFYGHTSTATTPAITIGAGGTLTNLGSNYNTLVNVNLNGGTITSVNGHDAT